MKGLVNFLNESSISGEVYVMLAQWGGNNGSTGIAFLQKKNDIFSDSIVKDICNALDIKYSETGYDELEEPVACYNFAEQELEWMELSNIKPLDY